MSVPDQLRQRIGHPAIPTAVLSTEQAPIRRERMGAGLVYQPHTGPGSITGAPPAAGLDGRIGGSCTYFSGAAGMRAISAAWVVCSAAIVPCASLSSACSCASVCA